MKTYWTTTEKPLIEKALNEANITGEARKTILRFERFTSTCRNNLGRGMGWETMTLDETYQKAGTELNKLNDNGYGPGAEKAPFWKEWEAYCNVLGTLPKANLGDHLA